MLYLFSVTVGPVKPAGGFAEDSAAPSEEVSDLQEVVSLKERMARYQAAVSRGDCRSSSANVSFSRWLCTATCLCSSLHTLRCSVRTPLDSGTKKKQSGNKTSHTSCS